MVLGHGPLDSAGTLPLLMLMLLVLLMLLGICIQLHHVGWSPATKIRMMMLPRVVLIYILIT